MTLALGFVACSSDADRSATDHTTTRRTKIGDSTFVAIAADDRPAVRVVDSVEVLWRSDSLARPTTMIRERQTLIIGDTDRLHIVTDEGTYLRTVGRQGQGPREFAYIAGVGASGDSIVAFDGRNNRLTVLTRGGEFLGTHATSPTGGFVNPSRIPDRMRLFEGGVLRTLTENVHIREPTRLALAWQSLSTDSSTILREWDDGTWFEAGGVIAYEKAFPTRAIVAIGEAGRIASGDGLDYCFYLESLETRPVAQVCRAREREEVGPGYRNPSVSDIPDADELDPAFRSSLKAVFSEQEIGDRHPSYVAMTFGDDGRLWVLTTGPEIVDLHPAILYRGPDQRPRLLRWEAYTADGSPAGGILVPREFDARVFGAAFAWGLFELDTGEIAIGRVSLGPAALEPGPS